MKCTLERAMCGENERCALKRGPALWHELCAEKGPVTQIGRRSDFLLLATPVTHVEDDGDDDDDDDDDGGEEASDDGPHRGVSRRVWKPNNNNNNNEL